ncbi:MAG: AAA family ATPase, partial [Bacilli bacterium]|nr:AAA family ATPase [Bacilli bacterium]
FYQKSPFDLSGGQKRRVAIAGIIALEPHILVLDEPTAGLDPQGSKDILNLFKEINKTGVTIILVTHDMDLVLEYADEVIVMQEGVVKEQGTPISIFSNKRFKDYSLDLPYVLDFASRLEAKGYKLDLSKIINVETLAQQIKKSGVKKHE